MGIKIALLVVFFMVMIAVGWYCRKNATDVNGFVLGGRSVGPWLTAFAYGTSYFSAVVFVGYAGQFGYRFGIAATWAGIGNALIGSLLAWVIYKCTAALKFIGAGILVLVTVGMVVWNRMRIVRSEKAAA